MKTLFLTCFSLLLFASCGVTLDSVTDSNLSKSFNNPLIVIPYEQNRTKTFTNNLKVNLQSVFAENNRKVEVILIQSKEEKLTLNAEDDVATLISQRVNNGRKDLVIFFKPTELQYYNGGLQTASYQIVAIDVVAEKEVWKANFSSSGSFGPSTFARSSAEKIFQKLRSDKIIE
ncbi:MAG: hypothetical protein AAFZ15_16875 [Bacteroidota bacterium]